MTGQEFGLQTVARSLRAARALLGAASVAGALILLWPTLATAQQIVYYHVDPVGSVRAVTDSSGAVIERHDYYAFGEECTTAPCAAPGAGQPLHFAGKERDQETGFDYFGARYYGSKVARFTTVDPVLNQVAALANPQRWNRYSYSLNNPTRFVDPDGRDVFAVADVMAAAANDRAGVSAGDDLQQQFGEGNLYGGLFALGLYGAANAPVLVAAATTTVATKPHLVDLAGAALEALLNPGPSAAMPNPATTGKAMFGRALDALKNFEGSPRAKADFFERAAGAINKLATTDWSATRHAGADGSHIFIGEGANARVLVIDTVGRIFVGSPGDGLTTVGKQGFAPVYGALKQVE